MRASSARVVPGGRRLCSCYQTLAAHEDNKFIFTIEKNTWFAMKSSGSYSLIGCTVAPAFEFEDLELAPKNWKLSTLLGIVE